MAERDVPFGAGEQFGFAEVLQVAGLRARSGRLILSGDARQAVLELRSGRLVGGDLLPSPPGMDLGGLDTEERRRAVEADIQRVLIEVLGWPTGRAAFQAVEVGSVEPAFDVDAMLIGALRLVDELQEAVATLPPTSACLVWADRPPAVTTATPLSALQRALLPLCNGRTSLGELARRLHAPDVEVLRAAQGLIDRQYVRINGGTEGMPVDEALEAALNRAVVALQVRVSEVGATRHRDRQVQGLVATIIAAVDALIGSLGQPTSGAEGATDHRVATILGDLQGRYGALELVALRWDRLEAGDLVAAHSALSGGARDAFYIEAIDGLYEFLLQLAVQLVEERIGSRCVAERVRTTLGALLLEIETVIHHVKPPATLAAADALSALRQKYFHLVA